MRIVCGVSQAVLAAGMRLHAGVQRSPARAARGNASEAVGEASAVRGEGIDIRRLNDSVAIANKVETEVIGDEQDDIMARGLGASLVAKEKDHCECDQNSPICSKHGEILRSCIISAYEPRNTRKTRKKGKKALNRKRSAKNFVACRFHSLLILFCVFRVFRGSSSEGAAHAIRRRQGFSTSARPGLAQAI